MQNGQFNESVPYTTHNAFDELEAIPYVDELDNESYLEDDLETKVRNFGKELKSKGRDRKRKTALMFNFKLQYPDIDLRKLVDQYTTKTDHFEDYENYEIANEIEDHFSFKKIGKALKKGVKGIGKGVKGVGNVAKKVAPLAVPIAGTVLGAGVGGVLASKGMQLLQKKDELKKSVNTVSKVKDIAKKTGMTVNQVKNAVKNPTIAQVQAMLPGNAVESQLGELIPLESAMKKGLESKGIKPSVNTSIEDLATQFHQKVVGVSNYEENWFENDIMYYEPIEAFENTDSLDASQSKKIVDDIVNYFKTGQSKPATAVQAALGIEAQKYQDAKKQDDLKDLNKNLTQAGGGFDMKKILIFAVIAVVGIVVAKKLL